MYERLSKFGNFPEIWHVGDGAHLESPVDETIVNKHVGHAEHRNTETLHQLAAVRIAKAESRNKAFMEKSVGKKGNGWDSINYCKNIVQLERSFSRSMKHVCWRFSSTCQAKLPRACAIMKRAIELCVPILPSIPFPPEIHSVVLSDLFLVARSTARAAALSTAGSGIPADCAPPLDSPLSITIRTVRLCFFLKIRPNFRAEGVSSRADGAASEVVGFRWIGGARLKLAEAVEVVEMDSLAAMDGGRWWSELIAIEGFRVEKRRNGRRPHQHM
ncbi:stress-inducible protein [Striga asiatica]|uniref:Stress-inducible protein n=1 Tax=Striga asiatica TaxID=4170 RepID=A0A5A7R114_STRAF|nr:stress-inducible protein [Striga asiatica]